MKRCCKCKTLKEPLVFNKQSRAKDGLKPSCRLCDKTTNQERYKRLETQIVAQVKEWQTKNPEKVAAAKLKYRQKHSVKISPITPSLDV